MAGAFPGPMLAVASAGGSTLLQHMTQHELLMLIAALLLVLASPSTALLWGLPFEWRRITGSWAKARIVRNIWTAIAAPFVAWLLHAIVLWTWHAAALFRATLTNDAIHNAQHICFLGSALLFWWALFSRLPPRLRFGCALHLHDRHTHEHSRRSAYVCPERFRVAAQTPFNLVFEQCHKSHAGFATKQKQQQGCRLINTAHAQGGVRMNAPEAFL